MWVSGAIQAQPDPIPPPGDGLVVSQLSDPKRNWPVLSGPLRSEIAQTEPWYLFALSSSCRLCASQGLRLHTYLPCGAHTPVGCVVASYVFLIQFLSLLNMAGPFQHSLKSYNLNLQILKETKSSFLGFFKHFG